MVVSGQTALWASDTIWWHRYGLKLAQVMAYCLMAPSHYLNQYDYDFSSMNFCAIHMSAISLWVAKQLFGTMHLKNIIFKLLSHLWGGSESNNCHHHMLALKAGKSLPTKFIFNPLTPGNIFICKWTRLLIQAMTCHLFSAKSLPKSMVSYCNGDICAKIQFQSRNTL